EKSSSPAARDDAGRTRRAKPTARKQSRGRRSKEYAPSSIEASVPAFPPREERQPLEKMHVLLVLQERPVQRWNEFGGVLLLQGLGRNVLVEQKLQPVEQLARRRLLLEARHVADLIENVEGFRHQFLFDVGIVHVDDLLHRVAFGKLDVVEEAATKE